MKRIETKGTRTVPILSEKQREYWRNCTHRWNVKYGATRAGKTYMDYFLIPRRILERKGKDGLNVILGNTRETIRRNVLIPMQNMYGVQRVGNIRNDNSCLMFGEQVFILGADNVAHVDRLRGSSIKYAYGDEVVTWHPEVFEMLKSRLDKEYSCYDGTCNPGPPSHWFKKFLDSGADIYQQQYTIDDNPYLPLSVRENMKREYAGTVYYGRYILGEWTLAEGLIYPMWLEAVSEAPREGKPSKYALSIDYGTQNAFAALLWGLYGGTWYAVKEYYYSGKEKGVQKTDDEYGRDMDAFTSDVRAEIRSARPASSGPFGSTGGGGGLTTIIDPSATSFIALLRKKGGYAVRKADNDVINGLRETATSLKLGMIKISPLCEKTLAEIQGYVWDKNAGEDRPVKNADHCMDSMRYFVKTLKIADSRMKQKTPSGGLFG